jgi:hypothetical protein
VVLEDEISCGKKSGYGLQKSEGWSKLREPARGGTPEYSGTSAVARPETGYLAPRFTQGMLLRFRVVCRVIMIENNIFDHFFVF